MKNIFISLMLSLFVGLFSLPTYADDSDTIKAIEAFLKEMEKAAESIFSNCALGLEDGDLADNETIEACVDGDKVGQGLVCPKPVISEPEKDNCDFVAEAKTKLKASAATKDLINWDKSMSFVGRLWFERTSTSHQHQPTPNIPREYLGDDNKWVKMNSTYSYLVAYYQSDKVSAGIPTEWSKVSDFISAVEAADEKHFALKKGSLHRCIKVKHPEPLTCDEEGGERPPPDPEPRPGDER